MAQKILVIDDHSDTMQLIELSLEHYGFEVLGVKNGREGIAMAKEIHPDLIVLDIMMPDMDGYSVCRAIREYEPLVKVPIIMFSAMSQAGDKLAAFNVGADDYLTKPTRPEELAARVQLLLNRDGPRPGGALEFQQVQVATRSIAVMGARGGVGATTAAINIAAGLIMAGVETILVDLDLVQGHIAGYLDTPVKHDIGHLFSLPLSEWPRRIGDYMHPWLEDGRLLLTQPNLHQAPQLTKETTSRFLELLIQTGKTVVLDLGTQFGPEITPLLRRVDHLVLCLRPERAAVDAARRLLPHLREQRHVEDTLHVLMFDYRMGTGLPRTAVEKFIQYPLLDVMKIYGDDLSQSVNAGRPLIEMHPHAPISHRFQDLVGKLKVVEGIAT